MHATESAIIDWSYQIQRALKKESSEPLLQGSNPSPEVELEFWKHRYPGQLGRSVVGSGAGCRWKEGVLVADRAALPVEKSRLPRVHVKTSAKANCSHT